ncbi:bacterio-opsin activator domain-containing protein [Halorubrum salsamenti]|uniref:bacterio-opsin activator domain-containing protein n=1 Tax=Halorubrum salsamenti TaxID=2583990 RepID=UPI00119F8FA3|nr:bacterio-opsin activator domain-containing protein [Halorubrum salsamenti]
MVEGLDADAYEAVVTAAETYRAALVVRLGGEAGLRTGEITRVSPRHLSETDGEADLSLLAVPSDSAEAEAGTDDDPETETALRDRSTIDRETVIPASLAAEMRRYAESADLADSEPFVDVSPRRVQMIVNETAERAAARTDGLVDPDVTPRDLRRTFARRLLADRGVDPHAVREAGGWETMATLDDYLGPLDGEAIAEAIAGDRAGSSRGPEGGSASTALEGFEALTDGDGRQTPLETVPEGVVASDRWAEAWVVRGTGDRDRVEIAGTAGTDREALIDRGVTGDGPWRDAVEEAEPVATEGSPATAGRPAIAVPLRYRDVTHGALCVVSGEDIPVSPVERREIAALGRCLGWAVTAGRWRDLLHSDAVTEVEFHTGDEGAFLARASAALGCRIELASTVAVDDASRFYLSVEGTRPQALADAVAGASGVSDLRVIETREDGCDVSARVEGGSAVRTLTEHGATVRDATAEDGRVRVVADLPEGADVRPVADGFRAAFADARLASKESVPRSPRSEDSLREGVADRFTDRQWAALSAAYHGGYFDWPRGSTAEEVADAMGVSSPTFHNHLRKAQRGLLDELFEDGRRARRRGESAP